MNGNAARINVYGLPLPLSDCWVAYVPQPRGVLKSSEVIVIAKRSGEVLYHGSANDEG